MALVNGGFLDYTDMKKFLKLEALEFNLYLRNTTMKFGKCLKRSFFKEKVNKCTHACTHMVVFV